MAAMTQVDARALAAEAFVFGYPMVLMDVSRSVFTNAPPGSFSSGPVNELVHARAFPDASFTAVVSPNADTLYSVGWLDVKNDPIVLSVPDSEGRYYLVEMLSAWTDVFASPGTRTTGNEAGAFAIVGPEWAGSLPAGVEEIRSPTSLVWLIGRAQTNGATDYPNVHRFQDGLALTPLTGWGWAPEAHPEPARDPSVDVETPPPAQVAEMDAATFFGRLARLMVDNPPAPGDAPAIERFAAIGLASGRFEPDPSLTGALDEGVQAGMAEIRAGAAMKAEPSGWVISHGVGSYGTDYGKRAVVALIGLGANLDEDAIYPHTDVDATGEPLTGANRYVLHFDAGRLPPVGAFWSLTMYDDRHYFADNALNRYAIGDRDGLAMNPDGSLDLWIQHERPEPAGVPDWLPAPEGLFNLILRLYWPKPEVLDGQWTPPAVMKAA